MKEGTPPCDVQQIKFTIPTSVSVLYYFRGSLNFGVLTADQMRKQSHLQCVAKNLYSQDGMRTPVPYGVLDKKLVS